MKLRKLDSRMIAREYFETHLDVESVLIKIGYDWAIYTNKNTEIKTRLLNVEINNISDEDLYLSLDDFAEKYGWFSPINQKVNG